VCLVRCGGTRNAHGLSPAFETCAMPRWVCSLSVSHHPQDETVRARLKHTLTMRTCPVTLWSMNTCLSGESPSLSRNKVHTCSTVHPCEWQAVSAL
jgi:hypothetical protein